MSLLNGQIKYENWKFPHSVLFKQRVLFLLWIYVTKHKSFLWKLKELNLDAYSLPLVKFFVNYTRKHAITTSWSTYSVPIGPKSNSLEQNC